MGKEYIIVNKCQYYVTGKSKCGHIISFSVDTMVQYLGKGKVSFEFVDYEPIDKAAISLAKRFNTSFVWVVIKDNELHVYYSLGVNNDNTAPTSWKGHPVKYVSCMNQVIKV